MNIKGFSIRIKQVFCNHELELTQELYGDIRSHYNGYYKCKKCSKVYLK